MQTFRHKIFSCLYPALSALGAAVLLVFLFTDTAAAAECKSMAEYQKEFQDCFSCITIKVLLEAFMTAGAMTYEVSQNAGKILLSVGSLLWVAFFVITRISSLTNPEAPKMMSELLKFAFKVLAAYVMLNAGIAVLIDYFINPILAAGADLANQYLSFGLPAPDSGATNVYTYNGPDDIIDPAVLDKILAFTEGISKKVATNMVLGNGLMCHSLDALSVAGFRIIDLWLWLCGAAIWFVGFLLTIFVSFYLLDITFKIGFAVIMLPLAIGLWPFKPTTGRVGACFSIILKAAATYAFLAICATLAIILVDAVLDVEKFFDYIKDDKTTEISEMFSITGDTFLVFCIAFIYAIKLISKNQQLVNKFFPDRIFGDIAPLHEKMTGMASMVQGQAMKPVGLARDIATHQTGRAIAGIGKGIGKGAMAGGKFIGGKAMSAYGKLKAGNLAKMAKTK